MQQRPISTRTRLAALPALTATALLPRTLRAQATPSASPVTEPARLHAEVIAQLTGPADESINPTCEDYKVCGTDLGHTFLHGDDMYMIFGDTFAKYDTIWRSNVAAMMSTDQDPSDGLIFDRMITDDTGIAKALIPQQAVEGPEVTIIPTYGVAVEDRLFLHYMQVIHWGEPGQWDLGSSGFAYSDDLGETWTVDPEATWPGDSNFGQVAITEHEGYLYLFGIPGGRLGGVQLARVAPDNLLDLDAYEYWDGAAWSDDIAAAAYVVPPAVGELSVRWNEHYGTWVMMYLSGDEYAIVLRTADALTGPWSEERVVATGQEFPQLYAPYQLPKWNAGEDIYFTMSMFGPYQVFLMKTRLNG